MTQPTTRADTPALHVRATPTAPRATAPRPGAEFRDAFARVGVGTLAALERIVPGLPDGLAANAAVRLGSASSALATAGAPSGASGSGAAATSPEGLADRSATQAFELLALQQEIADEQRRFTTLSNVMKARHDTAKNLLGNLR